jgi:hypothetical protein
MCGFAIKDIVASRSIVTEDHNNGQDDQRKKIISSCLQLCNISLSFFAPLTLQKYNKFQH